MVLVWSLICVEQGLPLTLALSPQAGRGDVEASRLFCDKERAGGDVSLLPACGEKVAAAG
ncbi:hypothetical protein C0075_01345 [Rhizobium sp. KAs_5_22]|nr:hypothetical protein C0075_01345 [Rhizobium sp. KAs_5_22]